MCEHLQATISLKHIVERTFDRDGEQAAADRLFPDGRMSWHCPACGLLGVGTATEQGCRGG